MKVWERVILQKWNIKGEFNQHKIITRKPLENHNKNWNKLSKISLTSLSRWAWRLWRPNLQVAIVKSSRLKTRNDFLFFFFFFYIENMRTRTWGRESENEVEKYEILFSCPNHLKGIGLKVVQSNLNCL